MIDHDRPMTTSARRQHAIRWARRMLVPGRALILDTETIDLGAAVCEIAVIDTSGNTLLDTLVNPDPRGCWIHPDAHRVHGIDVNMLRAAPDTLPVLRQLIGITADYPRVLAYNSLYDQNVIERAAHVAEIDLGHLEDAGTWGCLMRARSDAAGHPDHYLPLNGGHRALGDCLAALNVLRTIAATDLSTAA